MSLTDGVLLALIMTTLAWAIYSEIATNALRGPVRLKIPLVKRKPIDSTLFILLTGILIYKNGEAQGPLLTTWLLIGLLLMAIYLGFLHQPKVVFKAEGFFYNGFWIDYQRVREINLSEDGVLVMQLEHRRLLVRVKNIDDLQKIYQVMITTQ